MPRGARLDAPGVLHHVMMRALEGLPLFLDDRDRADFLRRLAAQAQGQALRLYAWVLLPNHVHLLVRTGNRPLANAMRSLLSGYAGAFNRRHRRRGHLFQNRYKSIVVEEEPYFLELVRYIHLNPLRGGVVRTLRALDRYRWSGHAALVGRPVRWQETWAVLARFGGTRARARERYRAFVAEGRGQGRRAELQGGGLVRSAGGWAAVRALRRGRERWAADERILGSGEFVEAVRREVAPPPGPQALAAARAQLPGLLDRCAALWRVTTSELTGGGRRRAVAHARAAASYVAARHLGLPLVEVARALGISEKSVRRNLVTGEGLLAAEGRRGSEVLGRGEGKGR